MFGAGRGMGGGSGGGMLRTVGRTLARVGVSGGNTSTSSLQEPLSSAPSRPNGLKKLSASNNYNNLTVSTASPSFIKLPANANSGMPSSWPAFVSSPTSASSCCDEFEWVAVDGTGDERQLVIMDDYALAPVPSTDEVQNAVAALQQVFDPCSYPQLVKDKCSYNEGKDMGDLILCPPRLMHQNSSSGSEEDWQEPAFYLCNSRMPPSYGLERVYDAFHLLRTEPTVQRMVVSLSSDQAIWDAVLNNEVVRELRNSYLAVGGDSSQGSDSSCEDTEAMNAMQWIAINAKTLFIEVLEKITELISKLFKPPPEDKATAAAATDPFDRMLRTSFMLSVVVLLVVIVTRAHLP